MTGPVLENSSAAAASVHSASPKEAAIHRSNVLYIEAASLSALLDHETVWPRSTIVMCAGHSRISSIAGTWLGQGSQPTACSDGRADSVRYPTLKIELRIQRNSLVTAEGLLPIFWEN
jgi:hypothetical protein